MKSKIHVIVILVAMFSVFGHSARFGYSDCVGTRGAHLLAAPVLLTDGTGPVIIPGTGGISTPRMLNSVVLFG